MNLTRTQRHVFVTWYGVMFRLVRDLCLEQLAGIEC